jgi:hypothetical protein
MTRRRGTLLDVISDVFAENRSHFDPPIGVERVEKVDSDVIRVQFIDDVDYDLLCREAIKEGYRVEMGRFAPRVVYKGTIIARVGSESDLAKGRSIFIYLIPSSRRKMSTYRGVTAVRHGVMDPRTGRVNLAKFFQYNLKVIRLLERYRRARYEGLSKRLEFY